MRSCSFRHMFSSTLLTLSQSAYPENAATTDLILLTGLSVVDVRTGTVIEEQTLTLRGDRIEALGDPLPPSVLAGATVYDHSGHYVIPGLTDMHVHFRNGPDSDLAEENALWLRQYPGFGVTAVRDAGGDLPDQVLSWRDAIERGDQAGPRIFTSLRKLDGPTGGWEGSIRLASPADAVPAIDELESAGADFIKLYDGSIAGDVYLAAIAESELRGLKTAGHLPLNVMFDDAIAAGLDSVEHELFLAKAASGEEAAIAADMAARVASGADYSYYAELARLQESPSGEKLDASLDLMIRRGTAMTPTLYIGRVLDTMTDASIHESDPRLAEVPSGLRATFQLRVQRLVGRSSDVLERDLEIMAKNRELVKAAADRGVIILAGSDTGAVNSYLYPGDSLHRELAELVAAGLTPLQALQGATLHAAAWLNRSHDFGTIEPGKLADLVILDSNPLDDITNTRSIVAVLQSGRYLDQNALARLRVLPDPP